MFLMWAAMAFAGSLFVNGVEVSPSELASLELVDVDIRFDAQGNIFIDAPKYQLEVEGAERPGGNSGPWTPVPPPATYGNLGQGTAAPGEFFVLIEDQESSELQAAVYLNGRLVASMSSGQGAMVIPVRGHVTTGVNQLDIRVLAGRATGQINLTLGKGNKQEGVVSISQVILRRRATAADVSRGVAATFSVSGSR